MEKKNSANTLTKNLGQVLFNQSCPMAWRYSKFILLLNSQCLKQEKVLNILLIHTHTMISTAFAISCSSIIYLYTYISIVYMLLIHRQHMSYTCCSLNSSNMHIL